MKSTIDVEVLRKLLRYEPRDGKFYWNERGNPQWDARWAKKEALTARDVRGYRVGNILGRVRYAHRVAWALYTGEWPRDQIDHINGDRADNRIVNLREATSAQNSQNMGSHRDSSSSYIGVCRVRNGKWLAQIWDGIRQTRIGEFDDEREAAAAYDALALAKRGDYARVNFPSSRQRR